MKYVMVLWILHMGAMEAQLSPPIDIKSIEECTQAIKEMDAINPQDIGAIAIGVHCYKGVAPKKPGEQKAEK